jgi:small-conductance mechanosensitive channel
MINIFNGLSDMVSLGSLIRAIISVIFVFILFHTFLRIIRKGLLKKAKTKKQISNVKIFTQVLQYLFIIILIIFAIFSYTGSWSTLGVGIGLLTAALGFALQKPITGVAAWVMIVARRPFDIGDRIIIGTVKGDVVDITLTHIYLKEVGGTIQDAEDNSGRTVMVPNSILFEHNIINYTLEDEYILGQVVTSVTYESNLDKAMKLILESTIKHTKEINEITKKKPYVRLFFEASGIDIKARYVVPAKQVQRTATLITKEIYDSFKKHRDVEFAYPHTEVIYRKK